MRSASRGSLLLLLVLLSGQLPAEGTFGVEKTAEGCAADHAAHDQKYISGEWEPFMFTGPPPECDTPGCLDEFWAPQSRFQVEPSCPRQLVHDLSAHLRYLHTEGSWWATRALTLQPCDLWEVLKGRTTWVIGDSVTEDIAHAMAQMMLEYWDKAHWNASVSDDPNLVSALNHGVAEGAYGGIGKRVPYWCFQMGSSESPGRICYVKADKAKRSLHVVSLMPRLAQADDIMLINIGIHYNDMFFLSEDITMLGYALLQPGLPKNVFWAESGPQHYETRTGMFDMTRPITEQRCVAAGTPFYTEFATYPNGELAIKPGANYSDINLRDHSELHRIVAGGERNLATQPTIDSLGIPTLRSWNLTLPLHQFHTHLHHPWESGECTEIPCDCTHTCSGGPQKLIIVHFIELVNAHAAKMHLRHAHSTS